jgi:hypothetical protein
MHDAEDLDHTVGCHPVNEQMPGCHHAIFLSNEPAHRPEVKGSQPIQLGNIPRAGPRRRLTHGCRGGENQAVVPGRGEDTPAPSTVEQDAIDSVLRVPD